MNACSSTDPRYAKETEEEKKEKAIRFIKECGFSSRQCSFCNKTVDALRLGQLMRCARCKLAHYCSMKCVEKHFEEHRKACLLAESFGGDLRDEVAQDDNKTALIQKKIPKDKVKASTSFSCRPSPKPTSPRKTVSFTAKPSLTDIPILVTRGPQSKKDTTSGEDRDGQNDIDDYSRGEKPKSKKKRNGTKEPMASKESTQNNAAIDDQDNNESKGCGTLKGKDAPTIDCDLDSSIRLQQNNDVDNIGNNDGDKIRSPDPPKRKKSGKQKPKRTKSADYDAMKSIVDEHPKNESFNSQRSPIEETKDLVSPETNNNAGAGNEEKTSTTDPPKKKKSDRQKVKRTKSSDNIADEPAIRTTNNHNGISDRDDTNLSSGDDVDRSTEPKTAVPSEKEKPKRTKSADSLVKTIQQPKPPACENQPPLDSNANEDNNTSTNKPKRTRKTLKRSQSVDGTTADIDTKQSPQTKRKGKREIRRAKSADDFLDSEPRRPLKPSCIHSTTGGKNEKEDDTTRGRTDLGIGGLPQRTNESFAAKKPSKGGSISGGRFTIEKEFDVKEGVRKLMECKRGQCCYCDKIVPKHLMLECARCKLAHYCKMNCLQEDFDLHRRICNFVVEYEDYAVICDIDESFAAKSKKS